MLWMRECIIIMYTSFSGDSLGVGPLVLNPADPNLRIKR